MMAFPESTEKHFLSNLFGLIPKWFNLTVRRYSTTQHERNMISRQTIDLILQTLEMDSISTKSLTAVFQWSNSPNIVDSSQELHVKPDILTKLRWSWPRVWYQKSSTQNHYCCYSTEYTTFPLVSLPVVVVQCSSPKLYSSKKQEKSEIRFHTIIQITQSHEPTVCSNNNSIAYL
jgi:hypothetical protein